MDKIVIVFAADENYAQHLGVAMVSVLENTSAAGDLLFYIFDGGISISSREKIKRMAELYQSEIIFIRPDESLFDGVPYDSRITIPSYYRVAIPHYLEKQINKAIYLDCDIVVKTDIRELWELDLSGFVIAAVEDFIKKDQRRHEDLGMPLGARYFNAGVLVFDLRQWRKQNITNIILTYARANCAKLLSHDQDALNAVLYERWKALDSKWNSYEVNTNSPRVILIKLFEIGFFNKKRVIHYISDLKPWHFLNSNPIKKEYYRYLALTEWNNYRPPDKNLGTLVRKIMLVAVDWPLKLMRLCHTVVVSSVSGIYY